MKPTLVIRKGAAHWDATLYTSGKSEVFNFRTMTPADRAKWYTLFMSSIRVRYGYAS